MDVCVVGYPILLCVPPFFPFLALEATVFSSLLSRFLLSAWVCSPFGRGCGTLRDVWFGGELCVWGGVLPASELSVRDAWELCRFFWR